MKTKWEKEHQVRGRRIKQHLIKPAEDVGITLIIAERDIVLVVASVERQNYDNLVGEIDTVPLTAIKDFIDKHGIFIDN
jgi:hypothetical protein